MIYFILVVYLVFCAIAFPNRNKYYLLLFSFLPLFIVSAFRDVTVGYDLLAYEEVYKDIAIRDWKNVFDYSFEYGYLFYNKLLTLISDSTQCLILVTSLIVLVNVYVFVFTFSNKIVITLCLFVTLGYYCDSFNILRQYIALSIVYYSLKYIIQHRLCLYYIGVLIAASFHITAIITLFLPLLIRVKISWKYFIIILMTFSLLSFLLGNILFQSIMRLMYLSYSDEMIGGGGLFMFGFLLLITCWGLFYKKKKLTTSDSLLYHLMIWATAMQLLSYQFSLFSRVIVYFSFAAIVFIPNVICGIENRSLKTFYYSVFWGIQAFFFALYLNNNLSQVLPYSFFKY